MFEQAVYAGRNHTVSLAVALIATALLAPAARADDVAQVRLGSSLQDLIAGPDGGAWVRIQRGTRASLGRAFPDGRFITAPVDDSVADAGGALGPDGQAWFTSGLRQLVRMDPAGQVSIIGIPERGDSIDDDIATGPDGTLWATTVLDKTIAHVTPQGVVAYTRTTLPECGDEDPSITAITRAADGAMWLADPPCERLLRVTPGGAWTTIALRDEPTELLAPDLTGGVWFAAHEEVGHVDSAGKVSRFALPDGDDATDVAVAPDGSAAFALGRCVLARAATPGGPLTFTRIPVPARHVAFDPVGGLWLTSGARLVHIAPTEPAGACDETPPTVRVTPRERVSVGALRRSGLRIAVREPAAISALAFYRGPGEQFDVGDVLDTNVEGARGGTVRYRVPRAILRRFARAAAARRGVEVGLLLSVTDREGNTNEVQLDLRVS